MLIRRIKTTARRWRKAFYTGPDWVNTPKNKRSMRYKSPTIAIWRWLQGYFERCLSLGARWAFPVVMLIFMYCSLALEAPLKLLGFVILALIFCDIVFGFIFRPKISIERRVPLRIRRGSVADFYYILTNRRSHVAAWDIRLDAFSRYKGLEVEKYASSSELLPGASLTVKSSVLAKARGEYHLIKPICQSFFPFSLFTWNCRSQNQAAQHIVVYPDFKHLYSLQLPDGKRFQREGLQRVSKVGESMDFAHCREFVSGDDPRHIHWRSSARHGEIVVKEYEEQYLNRSAIIMDNYLPQLRGFRLLKHKELKKRSVAFEAAISLCAALCDFLSREDYVVDIFAAGEEVWHFKSGRHLMRFDALLDILATLESSDKHPIKALTPALIGEIAGIGSCLVILTGWDDEREELLRKIRKSKCAVKLLLIGDDIQLPDEFSSIDAVTMTPEQVMSGKVRNL